VRLQSGISHLQSCHHMVTSCVTIPFLLPPPPPPPSVTTADVIQCRQWVEVLSVPPLFLQESGHSSGILVDSSGILVDSSGMTFGREACQIGHSGVFPFRWNWIIPEFTLEWSQEWCSLEWSGTEFRWNPFSYLLSIIHSLFICNG